MHLWQFPTKIDKKQRLHLFTNFATKAQKANPPNLAKPKPNLMEEGQAQPFMKGKSQVKNVQDQARSV